MPRNIEMPRDSFRIYYDCGSHWQRHRPFKEYATLGEATYAATQLAEDDAKELLASNDPEPFEMVITNGRDGPVLLRISWDCKSPPKASSSL